MAKKKKSSNKVVPVLVLAAVLAGGYFWLTSDRASTGLILPGESSTETPSTQQDDYTLADTAQQVLDSIQADTLIQPASEASVPKEAETKASSKSSTKNAYVDEYGNVIYTTPNGVTPIKYKNNKMGRWGYSITYPSFLTKESNTSDGRSFTDGKGKKLTTYAAWNVFNESISDFYQKDFPEAKSVTYKKLFRKQKCYIKSGYTKNNQIFYMKEALFTKDDQEVVATLVFYYPKSYNQQAEKVINQIFPSFPQKTK